MFIGFEVSLCHNNGKGAHDVQRTPPNKCYILRMCIIFMKYNTSVCLSYYAYTRKTIHHE